MKKINHKKNQNLIKEVAAHFGGIPQLAKALNIDRHAIYQWKSIPISRAFQIEVLTHGKFKANDLLKNDM